MSQPEPTRSPTPTVKLGERVRALRRRHGWSLANVAARTGLATSTLSRIENDQLSLTYEKLLQLCAGLGVDLAELLAETAQPPAVAAGRRAYSPPETGREIEAEPYHYRYLCTELTQKRMTPIVGSVTAKTFEEVGSFLRHEGEEVVYVLEGVIELHTEFYEPLRVEAGGCVYFDAAMGHAFVAPDGPARFLSVCTAPEPRLIEADAARLRGARARPDRPRVRR